MVLGDKNVYKKSLGISVAPQLSTSISNQILEIGRTLKLATRLVRRGIRDGARRYRNAKPEKKGPI